jgi:hypothetical protein
MTDNNGIPEMRITIDTVEDDELSLLSTIRQDIQQQLLTVLEATDEKAFVLASVLGDGVYITALVKDQNGKYRFGDITPTSVYQIWQLKKRQYDIHRGAWFSMQFTAANDGFIIKTEYNYDKEVFTARTPENWFVEPETPEEEYKAAWDDESLYTADLNLFPRDEKNIPSWLK